MEYQTVVVNLLMALSRNLDKTIPEKMQFAGANSGNLIFTETLKKQLVYEKEIWLNANALKEVENPAVIIPAANFIIQGNDSLMQALIRFLEQTDCPVTMAGLGAQAPGDVLPAELVARLSEAHIRAFKMLSERAVSIGVRGEYTAECLNRMGIHNVKIIGCPSFYFRRQKHSHRLKIPSLNRAQVTITPGRSEETRILELGMRANAFWLMQMMSEEPELAFGEKEWGPNVQERVKTFIEKNFPDLNASGQKLWKYMQSKSRIFFDKQAWNQFYDEEDITFAFGSRFHGNMAAFQNGVPALWIVHDIRTRELVKTLHLPHIDYERLAGIQYPEELPVYCDYSDYEMNYKVLHDRYVDFLKENHLKPQL